MPDPQPPDAAPPPVPPEAPTLPAPSPGGAHCIDLGNGYSAVVDHEEFDGSTFGVFLTVFTPARDATITAAIAPDFPGPVSQLMAALHYHAGEARRKNAQRARQNIPHHKDNPQEQTQPATPVAP